jgi:hypothetical protein
VDGRKISSPPEFDSLEYNTEVYSTEISYEFVDSILVAEDTDKGRAVGSSVMNDRFSQTARNVLTT